MSRAKELIEMFTYRDFETEYKKAKTDEDKFDALFQMMGIEHGWTEKHRKLLKKKHKGDYKAMLADLEKDFEAMDYLSRF